MKNKKRKKNYPLPILIILLIIVIAGYIFLTNTNGKTESVNNNPVKISKEFEFTKEGELTFQTPEGKFKSKIDIEIADDMVERAVGLMYREDLKENQGMLFVFPEQTYQSFWMKNTVLPLDILFVNKENVIVTIHKNTTPFSEESFPSDAPAIYVVEVNAGYTDKHNIQVGDKISWRVM